MFLIIYIKFKIRNEDKVFYKIFNYKALMIYDIYFS